MSLTPRKANERGIANFGWLDSRHSFSFGDYYDPQHIGFGPLRVINDDRVAVGAGFPMHGHQDMEIISYILDGALEHKDSLGTGSVMSAHDVQIMSAGAGIRHSEFNPSSSADVHFLQIWIRPNQRGLAPSYAQKTFPPTLKQGRLCLIASPDQRDDSLLIHSPCDVYASVLRSGDQLHHQLNITHKAWVQIAAGSVRVNDITLNEGDGLAIENESALTITGIAAHADIIVFDMAELTS